MVLHQTDAFFKFDFLIVHLKAIVFFAKMKVMGYIGFILLPQCLLP